MPRTEDFMLTAEELRTKRARRRRRFLLGAGSLFVLVIGLVLARPVRSQIKSWQSRRHAEKAFALIAKEDWKAAKDEAVAAYQLQQTEPQAVRAVARFLTRVRQPQALDFWIQLEKLTTLSREDLRDEAAIALFSGETARAEAATKQLIASGAQPADWLLHAQVAAQSGAADLARDDCEKVFADAKATRREQLQAAMLQLSALSAAPADQTSAIWARIEQIARGDDAVALDALTLLAQRALSANQQSAINDQQSGELSQQLERHPLAHAAQKLLALDLLEHADPTQHAAMLDRAVAEFKSGDPADVATLARWLNGKGEYQRVIDQIPLDQAVKGRELFLQYCDALGALGRWAEIKQLLESSASSLDGVVKSMYLARCNAQLGEKAAAENNWQRAIEEAGGDAGKLMQVGEYAEKNGLVEVADSAYSRAALEAPKLRAVHQARLRIARARKDSRKMHDILVQMLSTWPNDRAIQNDEGYTRLLLLGQKTDVGSQISEDSNQQSSDELESLERLAQELVAKEPASLPHRTLLALARLKAGRANEALAIYEGLNIPRSALSASALTVHAAILSAVGNAEGAKTEADAVPHDQLLPEEAALLGENAETLRR